LLCWCLTVEDISNGMLYMMGTILPTHQISSCLKMKKIFCNMKPSSQSKVMTIPNKTVYYKQDSLLQIVLEIFKLYKSYQKNKVSDLHNDRIQFEYNTISNDEGVEFLLENVDLHQEVRFLVPLGIDLAQELGYDGLETDYSVLFNPEKSTKPPSFPRTLAINGLTLLVTFKADSSTRAPDIKLHVPPLWERTFSKAPTKLPSWVATSCVMEYKVQVYEMLNNFVNSLKIRKQFFLALISVFGSPLEYDSVHFARITFFLKDIANAIFTIPDSFPEKLPPILLIAPSTVNTKGSAPKTIELKKEGYPWSPRWPPEEMAKRIQKTLGEIDFKKICADESNSSKNSK